MPIYGPLAAETPEKFKEQQAFEIATGAGVYGPLAATVNPADVVKKIMEQPVAPLAATTIGSDYTVAELKQAIEADPQLATELALTEIKRPQGPRKGALQFFATLPLDAEVLTLVNGTLEILSATP